MQLYGEGGGGSAEALLAGGRQVSSGISLTTWGSLGAPAASAFSTSETLKAHHVPSKEIKVPGSYWEAAAGTARRYEPTPAEHADVLQLLQEESETETFDIYRELSRTHRRGHSDDGLELLWRAEDDELRTTLSHSSGPQPRQNQKRGLELERPEAWADEEHGFGDEHAPLLLRRPDDGRAAPQPQPPKKSLGRAAAHGQLESVCAAALGCLSLFFGMLTVRLQSAEAQRLPLIVDFLPLFALPCFVYLAAAHFAAAHIPAQANLARGALLAYGFLSAVGLQALFISIFLRATDSVPWSWVAALSPFWASLALLQLLLCFLAPGFSASQALGHFAIVFATLWTSVLSALLVGLKLDGQIGVPWWVALLPLGFVLSSRVAMHSLEGRLDAALMEAAGLVSVANLALKQDDVIDLPWAMVILPLLIVLMRLATEQCRSARS